MLSPKAVPGYFKAWRVVLQSEIREQGSVAEPYTAKKNGHL